MRPYAHVLAGVGYFATTSELSAYYETVPLTAPRTSTTRRSRGPRAAASRSRSGVDVSIDLGVRYLANGAVDYLTQDSIAGDASGALRPHHGEAHVVTFTVGIAFGR